jgi:hypothetical protein
MDLPTTNPYPYITAAYCIGIAAMSLYSLWLIWDEKKLKKMLAAVEMNEKE